MQKTQNFSSPLSPSSWTGPDGKQSSISQLLWLGGGRFALLLLVQLLISCIVMHHADGLLES